MLKLFRAVAYLEGISFLLLLGIAMPLKYMAGMPEAVRFVGWAHGVLFMAYVGVAFVASDQGNWPLRRLIESLVAAVLPFGPFWLERRWRRG